jgi:hypothetical protein
MNATRRHASDTGFGRSTSDAAVRGALLIGVAVIIGLLLLWRAHDDNDSSTARITSTNQPTATTTAPATGASTPPANGSTPPPESTVPVATTHAPNQVSVLVANGSGTKGGASTVTNKLIPKSYATLPAADADKSDYKASKVYYRAGYAEDAKQVARDLGVAEPVEAIIEAMPEPPPVRGSNAAARAAQAHVLVLLGSDQVIKQS